MSTAPDQRFSIRELCGEFGVTPRTLRFYEDKDLIAPLRDGGARVYSVRDRARLRLILQGRSVGFSLAELRDTLDLYDEKDGGARQMGASLVKFRDRIEALRRQRDDIDEAIISLEDGCARLESRLGARCAPLLPCAGDYEIVLRARLDGHDPADATLHPNE